MADTDYISVRRLRTFLAQMKQWVLGFTANRNTQAMSDVTKDTGISGTVAIGKSITIHTASGAQTANVMNADMIVDEKPTTNKDLASKAPTINLVDSMVMEAVSDAFDDITTIEYQSVNNVGKLPQVGQAGVIYLCSVWEEVENPTGNPHDLGYYVYTNGEYVLTADTTVQDETTYYTKAMATDEYIWLASESRYEPLGQAKVDLTGLLFAGSATSGGTAYKAAAIPFGRVDSTSTSTNFTASVEGITALEDGVCVLLQNGVVTSASGFTININNLGAHPCFNNMTAATRDTTIFAKDYTMLMIYDATRVVGGITGAWCCYRGYDANTNTIGYQVRTNSATLPVKFTTYKYRLYFTSADGTHWIGANASTSTNATSSRTPTSEKINPFGPIIYYSTNGTTNKDAVLTATTIWQQYSVTLGYSFNHTGAALVLEHPKPVYLKCTPQSDGSVKIAGSSTEASYVQALPTTEDGFVYIFLGIAYAATTMELRLEHPVYYFKDGAIRIWTNNTADLERYNSDRSEGNVGTDDYGQTDITIDDVTTTIVSTQSPPLASRPYVAPSWRAMNQKLAEKADADAIPTKTSDLTNDSGFITGYTETDPVFTASAAHGITSSDISNWNSKTSNVGTITGITMNGASKGTSGVVDLGTVITAHQDISGKANKANQQIADEPAAEQHSSTYDATIATNIKIDTNSGSQNANVVQHDMVTGSITGTVNTDKTKIPTSAAVAKYVGDIAANKQDTISDLATIRSGASAGATAIQPEDIKDELDPGGNGEIADSAAIAAYIDEVTLSTFTLTLTASHPIGWYRVMGLGQYFSGVVTLSGAYYNASPSIATFVIGARSNDTANDIVQINGSKNTNIDKIRLVSNENGDHKFYLDIHKATAAECNKVVVTFNGYSLLTDEVTNTVLADVASTYIRKTFDLINGSSFGNITASKFITSGGTSSQFIKGDGTLDSNTYATRDNAVCGGDYITNSNSANTGSTKKDIFINHINDRLYAANSRFYVTHKVFDSSDDSFVKDLSTNVFSGNLEQHGNTISEGQYAELYIGTEPEATLGTNSSMLWTYGNEVLYLTFYTGRYPDSIDEAKLYHKYNPAGWDSCTITKISSAVYKIVLPNKTYPAAIKIKWSGSSSRLVSLSDVKAFGGRSTLNTEGVVTKYGIKQDLWGDVEAPKFIKRGGTSSQFLKADGSVDSTAYGTYSKPSGGIPKTDLASAVQTSLGKADTALQSHQDISGKVDKNIQSIADGTQHSTTTDTTISALVTIGTSSGTQSANLVPHEAITGNITGTPATDKNTIPTSAAVAQYVSTNSPAPIAGDGISISGSTISLKPATSSEIGGIVDADGESANNVYSVTIDPTSHIGLVPIPDATAQSNGILAKEDFATFMSASVGELITYDEFIALGANRTWRFYYIAQNAADKAAGKIWRVYLKGKLIGEWVDSGTVTLPVFPMRFPFRFAASQS